MIKIILTSCILITSIFKPNYGNQKSSPFLKTGWYYIEEGKNNYLRSLDKSNEQYYINPNPILTVKNFSEIEIQDIKYNGVPNQYVLIKLDSFGKDAWSIATDKAMNKKLALIIDDKLIYTPTVNNQITSGLSALNRGIYSKAELEAFINIIKMEM